MEYQRDINLTREDLIHILERSEIANIELQVKIEDLPEETLVDYRGPCMSGEHSMYNISSRPATREIHAEIKFRVKTLDLSSTKLNIIFEAE